MEKRINITKSCIVDLLERVDFTGSFWDCACGTGKISDALIENDKVVISTDVEDYGYSYQTNVIDFLEWDESTVCNIIMNPPIDKAFEFTFKALELTSQKVAIINYISFLNNKKIKKISDINFLQDIFLYSNQTKMMALAWFVFNKNYKGKPSLDLI